MSANQPVFLGSKNIGKGTNVSMSWSLLTTAGDSPVPPPFTPQQIPQNGASVGYLFLLDPVANQGAFTFGDAVAMHISIQRIKGQITTDGTEAFVPGRVIVFCPTTGQLFVFSPRDFVITTAIEGEGPELLESDNNVLPLFLAQGSQLQIWIENDDNNTAVEEGNTVVNITLFNFPVSPVGVSA